MRWVFLILLMTSSAFGQVDFDTAYAKLKAKQGQTSSRPTIDDLQALLNGIVRDANTVLSPSTDGLTTAQADEIKAARSAIFRKIADKVSGRTCQATVLVVDVEKISDDVYEATGEIEIPAPEILVKSWKDRERGINASYDGEIQGLKDRRAGRTTGDDSLTRSQIAGINQRRAKALADEKANREVPKATVRVLGGKDLLFWATGQRKYIASVKVEDVGFELGELTNEVSGPALTGAQIAYLAKKAAAEVGGKKFVEAPIFHLAYVYQVHATVRIQAP